MESINEPSTPWMGVGFPQKGEGWGNTIDRLYPQLEGREHISRFRIDPSSGTPITFMGQEVEPKKLKDLESQINQVTQNGGQVVYYREQWKDGIHYLGVLVGPVKA